MDPVDHFRIVLHVLSARIHDRRVVLALSGGPDSTALAHLAVASGFPPARLVAAHLDHRIRPESADDARFVRDLAARLGIEAVVLRRDVPRAAGRTGLGIEAVARRLRYRFLERAARRSGANLVLTAHHLDDQAETLLLRILRGTGVPGLAAIRARRPIRPGSEVILSRPLLGFARKELRDWLHARGERYVVDPGNEDGSNRRSLVRTRLLPELAWNVPGLASRLAAVAADALRLRRRWASCARRQIHAEGAHLILPPGAALPRALLRERLLGLLPDTGPPLDRNAMRRLGAALARGRGDVDLGLGWTAAVSDAGRIVCLLSPGTPARISMAALELPCPGAVALPGWGEVRGRPVALRAAGPDPLQEVIDAGCCPPPYKVRFAEDADRFRPLGMDGSTRVFRFLMGRKVPRRERPRTPVVLDGRGVVWVVGHRIADRARLTAGTTERVALTALPWTPSNPSPRPPRPS